MARDKVQARLDPGDIDRISEYKEEMGIEGQSEALRRLIRAGLASEGFDVAADVADTEDTQTPLERLRSHVETAGTTAAWAAVTAGIFGLLASLLGNAGVAFIGVIAGISAIITAVLLGLVHLLVTFALRRRGGDNQRGTPA